MADFKTEERFSIVTSRMSTIYLSALIISFTAASFFFLIFVFSQIDISTTILIFGIVIFLTSFISIVCIRTEYILAINNEYQRRPPIQLAIIFIVSYVLIFIVIPDTFMNMEKGSPVIFSLLAIPPLAIAFLLQRIYHDIFIHLINIFGKISPKRILHKEQITDKIEVKFNETKRYGGTFSIILISITMSRELAERVKQTMLFILFFNILRECIRKTDQIGIFDNGCVACVLSNNNNFPKAELQAQRLVAELEKNPLLKKKLAILHSQYKYAIVEFGESFTELKDMIKKASSGLEKALQQQKS
jgi:GGDEF domain-containing protein